MSDAPRMYTLTTDGPKRTKGIRRIMLVPGETAPVYREAKWWPPARYTLEGLGSVGAPPPGTSYTLLNLSAGTPGDHLAALLEFHGLLPPGTVLGEERIMGYYWMGLDLRCELGPVGYSEEPQVRSLTFAEAAALTVIDEGETDAARR